MKCTSRKRMQTLLGILLLCSCLLCGCGGLAYGMPYDIDLGVSSFDVLPGQDSRAAEPFAGELCVVTENVAGSGDVNMEQAEAAILCDVNNRQVLFAKDVHKALHPASLTKIMTALVALENGSLDQVLTATSSVNITESGAQLLGLKPGDTMTLDQALRVMLIYSANDVAMLVAEGVGGTVENFVGMMNEEAERLGATNTHFTNPHGLTDTEHLTTAYDLYLIFNEAIKNETFREIIQMTGYQTTYYDSSGAPQTVDKRTTNLFLQGQYQAPANVTVIGGKTGTTKAAGSCLLLLSKNVGGASYISVILGAESRDVVYAEMIDLLEEIN